MYINIHIYIYQETTKQSMLFLFYIYREYCSFQKYDFQADFLKKVHKPSFDINFYITQTKIKRLDPLKKVYHSSNFCRVMNAKFIPRNLLNRSLKYQILYDSIPQMTRYNYYIHCEKHEVEPPSFNLHTPKLTESSINGMYFIFQVLNLVKFHSQEVLSNK